VHRRKVRGRIDENEYLKMKEIVFGKITKETTFGSRVLLPGIALGLLIKIIMINCKKSDV
jgi:CxxC motif-containing protein (DUF1111 family)